MTGAAPLIQLRPVGVDDASFVREVYASSRADELASVPWTDEQRAAFVEFQCQAQSADYERRFPASEHSIVLVAGTRVGRIWVVEDDDELRLLDLTVLPAYQGRGIGTALLRRLQERAASAGVALRHTVLTTNTGASRLYERVGFNVIGSTDTHHLMEWHPPGGAPRVRRRETGS